jgi:putative CocE/NonD family hydrolase
MMPNQGVFNQGKAERGVSKQTVSMLTRDGVRLDADVYRPAGEGPFPVLLMRQPYGRAIASTVVYAHPTWYAAQGYLVVIQDVRGRGTSEGEFKLFAHEMQDGYDAVQWAANLPNSTGAVGMYGFSYQGMTQLYAAATHPPALKALCPAMIGYDLYTDWAYENGAFCLQANLGWAMQLAAETARLQGNQESHRILTIAAKNLNWGDAVPTRSEVLKNLDPTSFYHEWLDHPEPGPYWENLSPKTYLSGVDLPMLHIGGWFDTFLRGTLNLYRDMAARSRHRQQLIIGPWSHLPWGRKVGALDFGPEASSPCDRWQIRWFDHFLKGQSLKGQSLKDQYPDLLQEPPIHLFEMGRNQWFTCDSWPAHLPTAFDLTSTGLASISDRDGQLIQKSKGESPIAHSHSADGYAEASTRALSRAGTERAHGGSPLPTRQDTLVHDPWRPVPAHGGHATIPAGPQERSAIDSRTDVLTYTSDILTTDLPLAGEVTLQIYCNADTPSFDLYAALSQVDSTGHVYNFTQGHCWVKPGQSTQPLILPLQPTCISIPAGHALRLSLSATNFPAYPVNPGSGMAIGEARLLDQQIITITVFFGEGFPSQIHLPIRD